MKLRCVISFALGAAAATAIGIGGAIADRIPSNFSLSEIVSVSDIGNLSEISKYVDPDKLDELASMWTAYRGNKGNGISSSEPACEYLRENASNLYSRAVELYGKASSALREKYTRYIKNAEKEYLPVYSETIHQSESIESIESDEESTSAEVKESAFDSEEETYIDDTMESSDIGDDFAEDDGGALTKKKQKINTELKEER